MPNVIRYKELVKKVLITLLISTFIFGQIDISRLSFDLGYVSNYQFFDNYLFSPEIKLGGTFLDEVLEWEIHSSYWDEGISEELKKYTAHRPVIYHSNFTLGSKIYFIPSKLKFHLLLNSGFSFKYIRQKHFVESFSSESYEDKYFNILSLDIGIGFRYSISRQIRLRTELNVFLAIAGNINYYDEFNNGALKLGVDYFIK